MKQDLDKLECLGALFSVALRGLKSALSAEIQTQVVPQRRRWVKDRPKTDSLKSVLNVRKYSRLQTVNNIYENHLKCLTDRIRRHYTVGGHSLNNS